MSQQFEELDKRVSSLYSKIKKTTEGLPQQKQNSIEEIAIRINQISQTIMLLDAHPDVALGKLDDLKRSFSKCLDIVIMHTDKRVIEQLIFDELRKKQLKKLESEQ